MEPYDEVKLFLCSLFYRCYLYLMILFIHFSDSDSHGLSDGAVAGIVITVLIVVAAAFGVAFFFYRRKRRNSLFSPKHFDNPISYSSKAYDMDD